MEIGRMALIDINNPTPDFWFSLEISILFWAIVILWILRRTNFKLRILIYIGSVFAFLLAGILAIGLLNHRSFFEAVEMGRVERVNEMITEDPALACATDFFSEAAIHYAIKSQSSETVELLVKAGAGVNSRGESNITPLHLAASFGCIEITEKLLKSGADPNLTAYRSKETPLQVAAHYGNSGVATLLLSNGADPKIQNIHNETALDIAKQRNFSTMVEMLSK